MDLFAVQGTLKSLFEQHSSRASILWHSVLFIIQHSHPYMTTGKTIALTTWTFLSKVMSLLFNMLSRLVTAFVPVSKHLFLLWLHSPSAVILEPPKIKSATVSPSICHEVMGLAAMKLKRCLLLGRKVMTNLDSILKSRDITLSKNVCLVKAVVSPVVMYGCESWTVREAEP